MPNLKIKKCQPSPFLGSWQEKFLAVYLALVIVVAINFLVFSYLLKDREQARAFIGVDFANLFTIFPSQNVQAGANNVLVAEMITPDSFANPALACNFYLGNPCAAMVDADGAYDAGAGTDDDGVFNLLQLVPRPGSFMDASFAFSGNDHVCADALAMPIEDVYVDGGDGAGGFDCTPGNDGVDKIILDNSSDGLAAGGYTDVSTIVGGIIWFHSELVNNNIAYDYCDPAVTPACGVSAAAAEAATETIWIFNLPVADSVLKSAVSGGYWGGPYPGQWQGDSFATWTGIENFTDLNGNGAVNTGEPIVIDNDSDDRVTSAADLLIDANGTGAGIGSDDDALAGGATLTYLTLADKVCINNLGGTGIPISANPIIIYVDASGDCIPAITDQLIRDDIGAGLALIIAGLGTYPYTFFPVADILVYSDANANGSWDFGATSAATESLWLEHSGWSQWNTDAEEAGVHPWSLIDADGTETMSAGADDDGLLDNTVLTYLKSTDNVCFAVANGGGGIEDVYIDDNLNDCNPTNDVGCTLGYGGLGCTAHLNLIIDIGGDGLKLATTFDGQWVSGTGVFAYHDVFTPNYTWGINAGVTESLWTEIITLAKYSSSADDFLWNITSAPPWPRFSPPSNFVLTDLSTATGPAGESVYYVDADSSGNLDEHDSILEDNGVYQAAAPNGVIDRMDDYLNRLIVKNNGTAQPNSDYTLKICQSGANTWCSAPAACADMTWNGNGWEAPEDGPIVSLASYRYCFVADIDPAATLGRTIQLQIPKLVDTGATPGLYDAGEEGLFLYSDNDGPTDAAYTVPYAFTIATAVNAATKIDVTPGLQYTTSMGVPVYRLLVANTGGVADAITSLSPTPSGFVDDINVTLHFFNDANNNGIVDFGDTDLGASAVFGADDTKQAFDITDVTVPASGTASILITADIAAETAAHTFTLGFALAGDILMTVEPTGTFPMNNANALNISNTVPAVTVANGANDPAAKTAKASAANVAVKQLAISAAAGTPDSIVSLAPTPAGTEDDNANITSVVFYLDSGTVPGQVDGTDVQLVATPATYTADDTQTTFIFSSPVQIAAGTTVNILAVYNLGAGVTDGNTLTTIIPAAGDVASGSGIAVTETSGISALITIDTVSPEILSVTPANSAMNVAQGATLVIVFSEPMNTGTVTEVSAPNPGSWSVDWTGGSTIATYSHGPSFAFNTLYTQQITAGQDLAGNNLVAGAVANPWTFYIMSGGYGGTSDGSVYVPPVAPVVTPPATTQPSNLILHDPAPAQPLPPTVQIGTLVKRSDMSSVYFIDEDNRRHAFPDITTYYSWYADFSGVQTISAATLSAIPLGSNVTMRPGTYLLKIQSDSKVYAVEPYGVIRWVKTEQIATELFGASWSTRITDVEPTFFVNYQVGTDISTAVHPAGSVIQYAGSNDKFYIDAGTKKLIPTAVFSSNLFQDKFVAKNIPTSISYSAGADMVAIPISTLMTLR